MRFRVLRMVAMSADSAIQKNVYERKHDPTRMHKMIKRASDASSKLTKCAPKAHVKRDALPRLTHGGLVDRLSDQKNVHEREHNSTKTNKMIKRAHDAS
jgi:hypothetical protein